MARRSTGAGSFAGASVNALLFYAGLEIQHNIFGDNTSSPQTTELRIGGKEGDGAAEGTLMKWVHIASGKGLVLTGTVGLVTGNWFSFLGAIVGVVDMQMTYGYAKACGRRLKASKDGSSSSSAGVADGAALETPGMSLRGGQVDRQTSGGAPLRTRAD